MNWQLVRLPDAPSTPWRNGGGVTRELVAWPAPADWHWRISVAEVSAGGPFSRFDGVQRWFAVLQGQGVQLTVGMAGHELTRGSEPLCFEGTDAVDCELIAGATQDLNLMLRHGRARGRMTAVAGGCGQVLEAATTIAVYANDAPATLRHDGATLVVPAHTLAWQLLPAGAAVEVESTGAFLMEIEACA
jgi:environmental stress-induced protein Ves